MTIINGYKIVNGIRISKRNRKYMQKNLTSGAFSTTDSLGLTWVYAGYSESYFYCGVRTYVSQVDAPG
jgi:hypothetical protein